MKKSEKMNAMSMEAFQQSSYFSGENTYIESLYDQYLKDPSSVDDSWHDYFRSLGGSQDPIHSEIRSKLKSEAKTRRGTVVLPSSASAVASKQEAVDRLIEAYRRYGHFEARIDPLGANTLFEKDSRLDMGTYGLGDSDLATLFQSRGLLPTTTASLTEIMSHLKQMYTSTCGFEYMYIDDEVEQKWLQEYIEHQMFQDTFSDDVKKTLLEDLTAAEGLEKYLDSKYPGQKRFSIEGLDAIVPMLNRLVYFAAKEQLTEVRIGMAHRGRLNVMINVLGQHAQDLFDIFDGVVETGMTTGDVKYHMGHSNDVITEAGSIHMSMAFNPSHLEYINPVVMGVTRARQDALKGEMPADQASLLVLMHGDSAFVGEGIVMEGLNMSKAVSCDIGGTIHIVTNNQLGFTTSKKEEVRTGYYASSPAKMIDAPIFHVNANDVEMVARVIKLAFEYRMKFKKDVVIDLVGYRRHGHQEVDEPRATQPMMYKLIDQQPTARQLYATTLEKSGVLSAEDASQLQNAYRDHLDQSIDYIQSSDQILERPEKYDWDQYIDHDWDDQVFTGVPKTELVALAARLEAVSSEVNMHRSIKRMHDSRCQMTQDKKLIDWGYAETLAYATLLTEQHTVRLVGEDALRGTFYHRHAMLVDQESGKEVIPLKELSPEQAPFYIYNSTLSEAGALGFEYGYSMTNPNALVIWEAQFGDFANVAQVIIDQFISSAWQKWKRLSGLVMLLPHGYEGMGPEHSSARLERYLQLSAQNNMQVCVPSTPAQIFHLLRRQVKMSLRIPLVVMTPKSLLRHPLAVSSIDELTTGGFQPVLSDQDNLEASKVTRLILCSGKIYYELLQKRREKELNHIAIIRIEQLYPFPYEALKKQFDLYPNATQLVWCQEEPKNQGAWFVTRHRIERCMPERMILFYSTRVPMAAPSAGYVELFKKHQTEVVLRALSLDNFEPFDLRLNRR